MTTKTTDLTRKEATRLAELEETIERGLETFLEVGRALAEIRDLRLYRAEYKTFEGYCKARFGFTRRRGNQLIAAAAVGTVVPVSSERQARELGKLRGGDEMIIRAYRDAQELAKEHGTTLTSEHCRYAVERIAAKRAFDKATDTGDGKAIAELGKRHGFGLLTKLHYSPRGTYRGGGKPVRATPAAIEAHERAQAVSDEIRLVLGPWTADGQLPERRRVPESATITAWRSELANGNGSRTPSVASIIGSIEKLRASLPADSPDRAALTKALEALGEVT